MTKEKESIKVKKYYDVRVETTLPATINYRVLAEDEKQAVDMIKNASPNSVKYKLLGKKDIKLTVYDAGSTIVRLVKKFIGG